MSGSYLGKGFVSRSGRSIAPLAQAGVVFFYFLFFTNHLLLLRYRM